MKTKSIRKDKVNVITLGCSKNLVDSENLITQLRGIVSNIQSVTGEVSLAAGQIRSTTEYLSTGSEAQSVQITQTSNAVSVMAASALASNTIFSSKAGASSKAALVPWKTMK